MASHRLVDQQIYRTPFSLDWLGLPLLLAFTPTVMSYSFSRLKGTGGKGMT